MDEHQHMHDHDVYHAALAFALARTALWPYPTPYAISRRPGGRLQGQQEEDEPAEVEVAGQGRLAGMVGLGGVAGCAVSVPPAMAIMVLLAGIDQPDQLLMP